VTAPPAPSRAGVHGRPSAPDLAAAVAGIVVAAVTAACLLATSVGLYVVNGIAMVSAMLTVGLAMFLLLPAAAAVADPLRRWLLAAAMVSFAAALLTLPFAVMNVDGRGLVGLGDGLARDVALRSGDYEGVLTRCAGVVAIVLALRTVRRPAAARALLAAGALVVVGSFLYTGHPRTHGPLVLALGGAFAHVLAAAVWFGGVVGLGIALRTVRGDDVPGLLLAFARWMTAALALLFAGGLVLAVLCLPSATALLHSAYGQVLLVKLAVVGGVLVVSSANHRRLVPMAVRGQAEAVRVLRLNVAVEQIGLLAVVLITDVLVRQTPGG
jgi:copper transport protein